MNSKLTRLNRDFTRRISSEAADQIINTAERLNDKIGTVDEDSKKGLLFGQVQSGKTNNMLASIAKASDNGHRLFVVLTSDNLWLYEQTLERVQETLPWLLTLGKDHWGDESLDARINTEIKNNGIVLVSTKNSNILPNLLSFINEKFNSEIRPIIFDDEADQASLNTMTNSDQKELSAVNQGIVDLREYFPNHVYIQVTATPQALFLQGADSDFAPDFTIKFDPGRGYVGGDAFFEDPALPMRTFQDSEIEHIMDEESNLDVGIAVPTGLRQALCSFFVSASIKLIEGKGNSYSFLCHVSHKQNDHIRLRTIINSFITDLSTALVNNDSPKRELSVNFLREAYLDLRQTYLDELPDFRDVIEEIKFNIPSTQPQLLISGSYYKRPRYTAPFNILIGGNKLGRGVTIEDLLVTYYGRTSSAPKVDTLLQHARMYGYRSHDMDVVRFYTSTSILDIFTNIYESEKQLRKVIDSSNPDDLQALVLSRAQHSLIKPTRSNVIYLDSILFYMSGQRYFPRYPISSNVKLLDTILEKYLDASNPTNIKIAEMKEIINLTDHEKTEGGSWDKEAIIACLNILENIYPRGYIVVRTDRNISYGARSMLSPVDQQIFEPDGPTLTMYKYNCTTEKGWNDDEEERWVPNLRFPNGKKYYMFSTIDGVE